jgi:hypothetical protein
MRYGTLTVFLAVAVGLSSPVAAQSESPDAGWDRVHTWLRNLVTAQESYYADHGTYTTDLAALRLLPAIRQDSVWIRVVHAGGRSWTADAGQRGVMGRSCVIYIGRLQDFPSVPQTAQQQHQPAEEAVPVCDQP